MADKKIISVWMVLEDNRTVILQKRSARNKSFPYICQSTWSGKVEPGEKVKNALLRECKEELGEDFYKNMDFSSLKMFHKNNFKVNDRQCVCYNYIGSIDKASLKKAKLHKEALPKFILVNKKNEIYPITSKKYPKKHVVLFDDQYKVIQKILNGTKRNKK